VVSQSGKEATVTLLSSATLSVSRRCGNPWAAPVNGDRLCQCTALKIAREEMIHVMHQEHAFSDLFLKFLLERSMRTQADLVDQLFNNSEKRLARILLLMAEFGEPGIGRDSFLHYTRDPGGDDRHDRSVSASS